jgi:hypothetical protein
MSNTLSIVGVERGTGLRKDTLGVRERRDGIPPPQRDPQARRPWRAA